MKKHLSKYFLAVVVVLQAAQIFLVARELNFDAGLYALVWLAGFGFFSFNTSFLFWETVFFLILRNRIFPSAEKTDARTAVLWCLKNEKDGICERVAYAVSGNRHRDIDFWILSDSDEMLEGSEREIFSGVSSRTGVPIYYRRREKRIERKQGNIKEWLLEHHTDYRYFFVCDADSIIPPGAVRCLIEMAEHPRNKDIAIFQASIDIAHAKTLFARLQAVGQAIAQRFYFPVQQRIFGKAICFGHNCLIRTGDFLRVRLPEGILSHDIWETALLDRLGKRTVFCEDVVTFDEAPPNYLESRRRDKRWAKGTLGAWPLLFLEGIPIESRFFVFYSIFLYLCQPFFLFWLLSGFVREFFFSMPLFVSFRCSVGVFMFSIGVVFLHKFAAVRKTRDMFSVAGEIALSTILSLNNVFYQSLDLFGLVFEKRLGWKPMKKDPFLKIKFAECFRSLWSGSLTGAALFCLGLKGAPGWFVPSAPFLLSFILAIPCVYLSGKRSKGGL